MDFYFKETFKNLKKCLNSYSKKVDQIRQHWCIFIYITGTVAVINSLFSFA